MFKGVKIVKETLSEEARPHTAAFKQRPSLTNVGDKRVGQRSESDTPEHIKKPIFDV
jgi:hypothetical protein